MKIHAVLAAAAVLCGAARAEAQIVYSEEFNVDSTAAWTVNDPGLSDVLVDFFYDYSAIGVPNAPNSTVSRGLKLTANNSGNVFSGFSVSPTGQNFTGNYTLEFDLWQNYAGPLGPGGSGSTQLSTFGVGTSGTTAFWAGAAVKESVGFGVTLDGGSASDYRAFSSDAPTAYASGDAVYNAPGTNNSDAYYSGFTSQSAPAAQVGLFAGQTGSTDVGETAFAWRHVLVEVNDGFVTWSIDGLAIATIELTDLTLGGGNIFFGHSDTNAASSTNPNDTLLNVTLIDNIVVTAVPEPSTTALALFSLGSCLALAYRRRCAESL